MTRYKHLSQRGQILKRPEQHIGSTETVEEHVWLANSEYKITKELVPDYNQGLIHICYEVLSNAQDNYFSSRDTENPLKAIKVVMTSSSFSVWNDGRWIPHRLHEWDDDEEKLTDRDYYETEIIFGHLNSGENYDDHLKKRTGGGLHGHGAKLANIYSKTFTVEAFDPDAGKVYKQTWTDNMSTCQDPIIKNKKAKTGYTCVTFEPDFKLFNGMQEFTDTHFSIMRKKCIDCAMLTGKNVYFNDELLPVKTLKSYAESFELHGKSVLCESPDSHLLIVEHPPLENPLPHISFVNGIFTPNGGKHIDDWKRSTYKLLIEHLSKMRDLKNLNITPKVLDPYFTFILVCNLENPKFIGQTKDQLSSPAPTVVLPDNFATKLSKWDFVQYLRESVAINMEKQMAKTDGLNKRSRPDIPGFIDANWSTTSKSTQCMLIGVEGKSAKPFPETAISTIENGSDRYGIFLFKGKPPNVRNGNANYDCDEIKYLKLALGLKHGLDYSIDENFNTLRYGSFCILADADIDGSHIKGLIISWFHQDYPSLVERGFLKGLRLPIVSVTDMNGDPKYFYHLNEYQSWIKTNKYQKDTAQYFKGLGSYPKKLVPKLFLESYTINFIDDDCKESLDLAFLKKNADKRKDWLQEYTLQKDDSIEYVQESGIEYVPITEFMNKEYIQFSMGDNIRSIPSVVDGLKPSQRKTIWTALLNLSTDPKKMVKVAQFGAQVAKDTEYHHGEASLFDTIINLTQNFVGANNISPFVGFGSFGTRNTLGKDAASPRYIYIYLSKIARIIYRKEDDAILEYNVEDGQVIEPKYLLPIVPMLLCNGSLGIGTGWMSNIPKFNPLQMSDAIKRWLNNKKLPQMVPWYLGFNGTIEAVNDTTFKTHGKIEHIKDNSWRITELPIDVAGDKYVDFLTGLTQNVQGADPEWKKLGIAELREYADNLGIDSTGTKAALSKKIMAAESQTATPAAGKQKNSLLKSFQVKDKIITIDINVESRGQDLNLENMNLTSTLSSTRSAFNAKHEITPYESFHDIFIDYCNTRLDGYVKRKALQIEKMELEILKKDTIYKFIQLIIKNPKILQTDANTFNSTCESNKFYKIDNTYNYLLAMPISQLTLEKSSKIEKELGQLKTELKALKIKTPQEIWISELQEFDAEYQQYITDWQTEIDNLKSSEPTSNGKKPRKPRATKK